MASNRSKINLIWAELKYILFKKKYMAMIDITNRCNLRCKHCYHKEMLSLEDENPIEEWERRFKEYYKMGVRYVTFLGGEPSLRYDVLKLAEKYFPFIDVFTNGQIKIPEKFNHGVYLSLEGLEEEHDNLCGNGAFKRAVENYSGDKRVIVYPTFFKMNYKGPERLKEFLDFVRKMRVRGFHNFFYVPQREENDSMLLTPNQRKEIGEVLLEEIKRKDSILLMIRGMIEFFMGSSVFSEKCNHEDMIYFFNTQGKKKHCVRSENDCSRCFQPSKYTPPLYNFKEWVSNKLIRYKIITY